MTAATFPHAPFCLPRPGEDQPRTESYRLPRSVDHIVPVAFGGDELDPQNCRPACGPCNYAGGARITNAARARRQVPSRRRDPYDTSHYPPEAWFVRPGAPCHFPTHEHGCAGHLNRGWS